MSNIIRWKFYRDALSRDCSCDVEECKTGDYILHADHLTSHSATVARYEKLVKAARDFRHAMSNSIVRNHQAEAAAFLDAALADIGDEK